MFIFDPGNVAKPFRDGTGSQTCNSLKFRSPSEWDWPRITAGAYNLINYPFSGSFSNIKANITPITISPKNPQCNTAGIAIAVQIIHFIFISSYFLKFCPYFQLSALKPYRTTSVTFEGLICPYFMPNSNNTTRKHNPCRPCMRSLHLLQL